jgi:hypothetical protein
MHFVSTRFLSEATKQRWSRSLHEATGPARSTPRGALNLEGMVMKPKDSVYPHALSNWLKFEPRRTSDIFRSYTLFTCPALSSITESDSSALELKSAGEHSCCRKVNALAAMS